MNDQDIQDALGAVTTATEPLDPARVIAGAQRRRRRGAAVGVIASAGVAAAAVVGALAGVGAGSGAVDAPVADVPSPSVTTSPSPPAVRNGYVFQNTRPAVGTLAASGEVQTGTDLYFATRGTQWAVISRQSGQPEDEPFGWRKTVGDPNLGDPTSPGLQGVGEVRGSVFKSPKAATVVYTQGTEAWYGKIYRLAGIPGWVESSARIPGGMDPEHSENASVFVYDQAGKLITKFGTAKGDPLGK